MASLILEKQSLKIGLLNNFNTTNWLHNSKAVPFFFLAKKKSL